MLNNVLFNSNFEDLHMANRKEKHSHKEHALQGFWHYGKKRIKKLMLNNVLFNSNFEDLHMANRKEKHSQKEHASFWHYDLGRPMNQGDQLGNGGQVHFIWLQCLSKRT